MRQGSLQYPIAGRGRYTVVKAMRSPLACHVLRDSVELSQQSRQKKTLRIYICAGTALPMREDSDDAFALGVRRVDGAAIIVFFAPASQFSGELLVLSRRCDLASVGLVWFKEC